MLNPSWLNASTALETSILGVLSSVNSGIGGGGAAFVPDATFFAGRKGYAYDFTDASKLFQNSGGTGAVTLGDPIGYATDLSGNGNHGTQATSGSRPLYQGHADFDGSNDNIMVPTIDFSGDHAITIVLSSRKDASGLFWLAEFPPAGGNPGFWVLSDDGGENYEFTILSAANTTYKATPYPAPSTNTLAVVFDTDGAAIADQIIPLIDGATPTLTVHVPNPTSPTGFANGPMRVGSRGDGSSPQNGAQWRIAVVEGRCSPAEIASLSEWAASPLA